MVAPFIVHVIFFPLPVRGYPSVTVVSQTVGARREGFEAVFQVYCSFRVHFLKSDVIPVDLRVGLIHRSTIGSRLVDNLGLIMPLGSEMQVSIVDLGLFYIIECCLFAPAISYLAYFQSAETDWDAFGI